MHLRLLFLSFFGFFALAHVAAQSCIEPSAIIQNNRHNVRQYIGGGGFIMRNANSAQGLQMNLDDEIYRSLVYAGGLWIGGRGENNAALVAAATYSGFGGTDFFAGPVPPQGTDFDADWCNAYDRQWYLLRELVERHRVYFECAANPDCDQAEEYPFGYVIPEAILNYPAHTFGGEVMGAPFVDFNGDNAYSAADGDYPLFSDSTATNCCEALKGDYAVLWYANDIANAHTATQGGVLGLELEQLSYGFFSPRSERAIYHRVKARKMTDSPLTDAHLGYYFDVDLGNPTDDLAGTDPGRDMVFFYNGDANDESSFGQQGFGSQAPVVAFSILKAPYIADDESQMATTLLNDPFAVGIPSSPAQFLNWIDGKYISGESMMENDLIVTHQQAGYPTGDEGYVPSDVRSISATPTFAMTNGDTFCAESVFFIHENQAGVLPVTLVADLAFQRDSIYDAWSTCFACVPPVVNIFAEPLQGGFSFVNLSGGDSYLWDFGDGTTSTARFPQHAFTGTALVEVTLTISNACGSATGSVFVDPSLAVSVDDFALTGGCSVFPNPASDRLQVVLSGHTQGELEVYHTSGSLVHRASFSEQHLDLDVSQFASGMYIIVIKDGERLLHRERVMLK